MRSIAFMSEKGGSSKTTCVVNVATGLAREGKRVLVVDADPQGNATLVLLRGEAPEAPTLYHVLSGTYDALDAIRPTRMEGIDLIPADDQLADVNVTLASELARERWLRSAMRRVGESTPLKVVQQSRNVL